MRGHPAVWCAGVCFRVAGRESDRALLQAADTAIGEGDFAPRRGAVCAGGSAIWVGLAVPVPGGVPDLWSALVEATGAVISSLTRAREMGERALPGTEKVAREGHQVVRSSGGPRQAPWSGGGGYWSCLPQVGRMPVQPGRCAPWRSLTRFTFCGDHISVIGKTNSY